jgi:hypothetical protein
VACRRKNRRCSSRLRGMSCCRYCVDLLWSSRPLTLGCDRMQDLSLFSRNRRRGSRTVSRS